MEIEDTNSDEKENERYLFSLTNNVLLGRIVKGDIDPVMLAKIELANRGFDENGSWIGFERARKHFGLDLKNPD